MHRLKTKELINVYKREMRNVIFAYHGYIFKSKDLNEMFSKEKWYKPNVQFDDKIFNEYEKKNIETIKNMEKELKIIKKL